MTWSYINFYVFNFTEWYLTFCGTLVVSLTILLSFLNLLVDVAESFSIMIIMLFIVLPQITLLSSLQDLTTLSFRKNNLLTFAQIHALRVYYNQVFSWISS